MSSDPTQTVAAAAAAHVQDAPYDPFDFLNGTKAPPPNDDTTTTTAAGRRHAGRRHAGRRPHHPAEPLRRADPGRSAHHGPGEGTRAA